MSKAFPRFHLLTGLPEQIKLKTGNCTLCMRPIIIYNKVALHTSIIYPHMQGVTCSQYKCYILSLENFACLHSQNKIGFMDNLGFT